MPFYFYHQNSRRTAPMPRPKSEMTKSGKTIGVRVTQSEYEQWIKLGGAKWLRKLLQEKRDASV
jgi:hypothetical protein